MNFILIILAKYLIYLIAAWAVISEVIGVKSSFKHKVVWFVKLVLGFIILYLVILLLNLVFPSARPFILENLEPVVALPDTPSFPSSHAAVAALLATFIFRVSRPWGAVAFGLAILVGIGRVTVGAHYFIDVAVGLVLGVLVGWLVLKLTRRIS